MPTTARLGIDITAANKTGAAFASVEKSMRSLNSSFNQFKAGLAAIGVGNVFDRFISGIVRVNTETGRGKVAADALNNSFQTFALKVGQGGLIDGLENFAGALNASNREMNGLANVMGGVLGGALTSFGNAIPAITAEVKDMAAAFGMAADQGSRLAEFTSALDELFRKYGPMSRNAQDGFFGLFGSTGKTSLPPGTLDKTLKSSSFSASASDVEKMLASIEKAGAESAVKRTKAAAEKIVPPGTLEDIYGAGEAVQSLQLAFENNVQAAGEFSNALFAVGSTISSSLGSALSGLISGTMSVKDAFSSMAQDILSTMADLAAQLAVNAAFKLLIGSLGGGGGAGLNIGGMVFGGLFANGGRLGAGKWGIAGEAGPEIVHGPAQITPMSGSGAVNVTVINNSSAQVSTSRRADGTVEIMLEELANEFARGGGKIDAALQRGYGLRRAGR